MVYLHTSISYAHAVGVEHSCKCGEGFQISYARPLGQVHKNDHAILCVLTFCI